MITVENLIEMLSEYASDYDVVIMPEDTELSADICKGGIFLDGGVLVLRKSDSNDER